MDILLVIFIPAWLTWLATNRSAELPISSVVTLSAAIAIAEFLKYRTDGILVGKSWTTSDLFRLAIWNTISFALPVSTIAVAVDVLYHAHLYGLLWIVLAGIATVIGTVKLRLAEGIRPRQVKSGELYKRAMALSKKSGVRLERVSVVPFGRGRLTNAFSGWRGISITDDYGRWLRGSQLDFVIAHELSHVANKHGLKKLGVLAATVGALVPAARLASSPSVLLRVGVLWLAVLFPLMTFYLLSRRFEYQADREAAMLVGQGEPGIDALVSLYRHTGAPTSSSFIEGLFSTHPSLTKRVSNIVKNSQVSDERLRRVEQELHALASEA